MNKPALTFVTLLCIAAVSACSNQSADADAAVAASTQPASTETTAAPATSDEATATDPAVDAAAQQAVAAAANDTRPLVEGTDYRVIADGSPIDPVAGKVEVAEVFGYTCPACAAFEPLLAAWKRQQPADVNFVYVPGAFGGQLDDFARAYYAADSLNLVEKTHDAMYRAIHVDRQVRSTADVVKFYANAGGMSEADFSAAMNSFAINSRVARAKQFAQRSGVEGTPSLIVGGKYLVLGNSRDDQLRITNQLIARERAAQ